MDERHALLRGWLQHTLGGDFTMAALTGDASFRRYFRVALKDRSLMAADVPPDKEDIRDFTRVTQKLEDAGVRAPHVHAADTENGWLLLDDFGDTTGLKALSPDNADLFYHRAIDELVKVQQADSRGLPDYTHSLLVQEMCLFTDWYCDTHLQCGLTESQHAVFGREFERLAQAARAQPQVFVHRDYHSRNLMVLDTDMNVGVLDYQDAVVGPVTYDLVSLLKDCYIVWPEARRRGWIRDYLERRPADADAATFTRWFDWMGIQRHMKAIGIFARLHHRDGKSGYLNDIPRILGYITESLERYPELDGLRRLITQLPAPRTQP